MKVLAFEMVPGGSGAVLENSRMILDDYWDHSVVLDGSQRVLVILGSSKVGQGRFCIVQCLFEWLKEVLGDSECFWKVLDGPGRL